MFPSCPHCKKIAPIWKNFAKKWNGKTSGNEHGIIAEVDCTDKQFGGEEICARFQITGLPSLMYGEMFEKSSENDNNSVRGSNLKEYNGDKTVQSLFDFAEKKLIPVCSPNHLMFCSELEKTRIQQYQGMSSKALSDAIDLEEKKIEYAEKKFETAFQEMNKRYSDLMMEKELQVAHIKSKIKLVRSIHDITSAHLQ